MKVILVILALVVAVLVTGALVAGPQLRDALSSLRPEPSSTEVRIEPAAIGKLVETVSAPGGIEPHTFVPIAAEVSARVVELPFREGEEVRQGDVLGQLDDKDLKAALVSAEARRDGQRFSLQADQARLAGQLTRMEFAQRELERKQALYETGDVALRDLDQALETVRDLDSSVKATTHSISVAESILAAAEADIQRAEDGLANTVILAPMDGTITVLNVEVGQIVTGSTTNPGTVLMIVADLSRMILNAEVAESDIASVAVGQKAKVHINAYQDETFAGTVRQIALQRSVSPNGTGYFKTEVEIDLQGRRIYSGLIANVDIEIKTHEGIVVPYQSIVVRDVESLPEDVRKSPLVDRTRKKANVIYRMVDGKAACTPVKPGPSDLTHRVVLEGLAEGDDVIVGPYKVLESIKHDERVKVEEAAEDEDRTGGGEGETDEEGDDGEVEATAEPGAPLEEEATQETSPVAADPASGDERAP